MAIYSPTHTARFWSKAKVGSDAECWPWQAGKCRDGYGKFGVHGWTLRAHRIAWEMFNGEPLGERFACHTCDNPACVNPNHIYAGDMRTNVADAVERGRLRAANQAGESNPRAKLTMDDVREIRRRIDAGETNIAIARDFPVTHSMVSRIRRSRSWGTGTERDCVAACENRERLSGV